MLYRQVSHPHKLDIGTVFVRSRKGLLQQDFRVTMTAGATTYAQYFD